MSCICKDDPAQPWLRLTDPRCPVHSPDTARALRAEERAEELARVLDWYRRTLAHVQQRRAARQYRAGEREATAALEQASALFAGSLAAQFVGKAVERLPRCPSCSGPVVGSTAEPFCSWKCKRAAGAFRDWTAAELGKELAPWPVSGVFCDSSASAQVSSVASGLPERGAPACKETGNMSGNNEMGAAVSGGAEGGT
ncbi:MAG: hypothetical protein IPM35_16985 [Myxococcales bacterium]|nr:hypothetical protein [Myxococcales bacterium]